MFILKILFLKDPVKPQEGSGPLMHSFALIEEKLQN